MVLTASEKVPIVSETVSVLSSDPPCKDDNALIATVVGTLCLIKYELDIQVFVYLNCLISFVISL